MFFNRISRIWNPGVFQGEVKKKEYFEGWYFKLVDRTEETALAVIPGISLSKNPEKNHAFIMISDARNQNMNYFEFPLKDFSFSREKFEIKIAKNYFSLTGLNLDLARDDLNINASVDFKNTVPWPVRKLSPGVMGWYALLPFMECYHGVLSLDHSIKGHIDINRFKKDFTGGKGYIEKDWGTSMPSSWIWMQTNHFNKQETSLFGSIAKIPWFRNYFTGYIFGFLFEGKLYEFTTYNGSKISGLKVDSGHIELSIEHKDAKLDIIAQRKEGVDLPAPALGEMTAKVNETLSALIEIKLYQKNKGKTEVIYSGTGANAGLEFVGNIQELLQGLK